MQNNPNKLDQPNKRRSGATRRLLIAVGIVVAPAALALSLLRAFDAMQPDSFGREVARSLVQLIGIAFVTVVISVAVTGYQKERDREADLQQRKDDLLRAMLDETIAAYHDVKHTRRLMRANLWESAHDSSINVAIYDQHLAAINDAQLQFERLARSAKLIKDERVDSTQLDKSLRLVEKSLIKVVDEYEDERSNIADGGRQIEDLPRLRDFIYKNGEGWFHANVAKPVNIVLTSFQQALLSSPSG